MAVEGMWLPILLKKYNMEEMQAKGFKLTAEDIYAINQASLKDAVVGLVRTSNPFHHFCTGEIISGEGLLLTNHHCGYGAIQSHSSVENDYLTNGFWALSKDQELPNEGIGVCFLKRMEDVTSRVMQNIPEGADTQVTDSIMEVNISTIEKEAEEEGKYSARIKSFFAGNEYYLSVYKIYRDIRLVGAPPSAIGKFGGDTDNWMWPRHTGDFSMFRIYANKDNEPADYAEDNIPYKPEKFLEIAIDGVDKGDFTMVMGYPGTTQEYLPSFALTQQTQIINPARIKIRSKGLQIMKAAQETDPAIRIQYAAKVAGMANGWKKWIGENKGLMRLDAISVKEKQELAFQQWAEETTERNKQYGQVLANYKQVYEDSRELEKIYMYLSEAIFNQECIDFAKAFRKLNDVDKNTPTEEIQKIQNSLTSNAESFYKNHDLATDKKLFEAFVQYFISDINEAYHPEILRLIQTKFKGNTKAFTDYVYAKSMFPHKEKTLNFIQNFKASKIKKLEKDPIYKLLDQTITIFRSQVYPDLKRADIQKSELDKLYVKGLREMHPDKVFFPDANSTFRIAYGQIDNYIPMDAVAYEHQTTLKGIMEKDNPEIYDYKVPDKLKELYKSKDFGKYANKDGSMPVCFTASNHTTGGNSGSPILNGKGQLIGINFDRNWEGTMSDLMYDPDMCRNIALDIRYVLFIVDKYAGAQNLINELVFVKSKTQRQLQKHEVAEPILN
jgi:hypothetical protein